MKGSSIERLTNNECWFQLTLILGDLGGSQQPTAFVYFVPRRFVAGSSKSVSYFVSKFTHRLKRSERRRDRRV
jgi:hypothetical protein